MDREAWRAAVHGVTNSQTWQSNWTDWLAISYSLRVSQGFPRWCSGKESPANAGDTRDVGSTVGSGRSPGGRNDTLHLYFCLENFMDRRAWRATVQGGSQSQTRLNNWTQKHLTSSSLKTSPMCGWMRPSWQYWSAEDRLLEKMGKFCRRYLPQYSPMAVILFSSRRLAGIEAMVPPAKPTTTILPSYTRLRGKGGKNKDYKRQCTFTATRMATIKNKIENKC